VEAVNTIKYAINQLGVVCLHKENRGLGVLDLD
jgi:hypothetical protein